MEDHLLLVSNFKAAVRGDAQTGHGCSLIDRSDSPITISMRVPRVLDVTSYFYP
jgi:hypothetical protein